MRRILLTLFLLGLALVPARAQVVYFTRADLKQPLSAPVEKVLSDFVDLCAREKRQQLATHMAGILARVDQAVKLTPAEKAALEAPAKTAVEAATAAWRPEAIKAMRVYLSRTSEGSAKRQIGQWKPEQAGPNEPVENWTPPQETTEWLAALGQVIGPERQKTWQEAYAAAQKKSEQEIRDYAERWVREARGPMSEDAQGRADLMKTRLELAPELAAALDKAVAAKLEEVSEKEAQRAVAMLRPMPEEARQNIMGRSGFYLRFDRPRGAALNSLIQQAAAAVLPADTMARWEKAAKEERQNEQTELAEVIKPSELYLRQQMEMTMQNEVESLAADLSLDKARQDRLKKLSDAAVEASLAQAHKLWMQHAESYSSAERKRMRGNVSFGLSEELQAAQQPVWKDGLKELLQESELKLLEREKEGRQQRTRAAVTRACLAEIDPAVMFSAEQRAKLEPLVAAALEPLIEQHRQEYWSYSVQLFFQHAAKVTEKELRAVLDDAQLARWKDMLSAAAAAAQPRNISVPGGEQPEVPDMEAAVSAHLYKMFMAERKKALSFMMPRVEEAQRVLGLPEEALARLTVAAKGAVEDSLDYWRMNTERYVRQAVQSATPKNVLQTLAGTERVSFTRSVTENAPQSMEVWTTAVTQELNAEQIRKLNATAAARLDYRLGAMAAMSVGELDRRRRLTGEQCAKLEVLLRKVLSDYRPDLERYMSPNWYLQYYYAMVPMAGIPEKDLQAVLTPQQWKLCKERDLPDAMQFWEGIENNHKNRLKEGGNANQIFDGGAFLE